MKIFGLFLVIVLMRACEISSVDYAVHEINITQKMKTVIAGKPAVMLTVQNRSGHEILDLVVTVKAKTGQTDLDITTVKFDTLGAGGTHTKPAVFHGIKAHTDYNRLTYAVSYSD